jgi:hypothetical protein
MGVGDDVKYVVSVALSISGEMSVEARCAKFV